jgi:hypothetical protein
LTTTGPGPSSRLELLCWKECPSHERARDVLGEVLADLGFDPKPVRYTWVDSDAEAVRRQFVGSPTFRADGVDLFPPGPDEPFGLSCRLYVRRDGRPSPLPDIDDLRDALTSALSQPDLSQPDLPEPALAQKDM